MYLDIVDALKQAEADDDIAVVVLSGDGESFTSGADVSLDGDQEELSSNMKENPVGKFMIALMAFPKLVIAAVNGPAVGIGVTLLPHCDVVYASTTSSFWTPFSRIAVVPEFCSSVTFPAIMGMSRANEMLLLGKQFSATDALACGLVSKVFPPADLMREVMKTAAEAVTYPLASKSLKIFKKLVRNEEYMKLMMRVFEEEMEALQARMNNGDTATAVMALMEARTKAKL